MKGDSAQPGGITGREGELAAVEAALDRLERGEPVLLAVSGEAGIGKTRLLAEARRRADERGFLVLAGRSSQFESGLPFAAIVDALDDYVQSLPPQALDGLAAEQVGELAQVLPSLASAGAVSPTGLQEERYRAHLAVRSLLELLAAEKPLLLVLDDLHWADAATAELLSNLIRRGLRGPVGLAFAYRAGQLPARLAGAAEEAGDPEPTTLRLGPLEDAEARAMLGERTDPARAAEVVRLSGGNPFYIEELVRAQMDPSPPSGGGEGGPATDLGGGGSLDTGAHGAAADVPAPIAAALARELDALPERARAVAHGAAVAGETFSPELAAVASGLGEAEALAGIDELLERDLVRRTEVPRRFRFRHPIVHGAVYESAGAGWRLAAHGRVAAALAERQASPLARAPHVECSAVPGDADAVALLTEAGNAASLRAPAAAAHWFAAARRLLPEEDTGTRLGLTISMAQSLGYAGRLEQARSALDEVLLLLGPDEHTVRGEVAAAAARVDQLLGRHAEAFELLTATLAGVPDQSGPEATELKLQLAGTSFFNGDFEGLRRWVGEALQEATARGDDATRAAATGSLGAAEYMTGDLDAAREHLAEAERMIAELDDQAVARRLHSLVWHGMTEVYLERFDRAEVLFARGLSVARSTGHGHVTTLNRIGQALVLLWRGRIAEADELLEGASEAALLTGNRQFLAWATWARCRAAILRGDIGEAVRLGERSIASSGAEPDPVSAMAACYLAEAKLEAGDSPHDCMRIAIEGVGGETIPLVERAFRPHIQELLTRMAIAAGDADAAAAWAEGAAESAEGLGLAGRSAEAARAAAATALARERPAEALEPARDSVALAGRAGIPIDEARGRILLARALAASDRESAVAELKLARDALEALGASRYRDEAASELRGLGERVARPRRGRAQIGEGVASLSDREQQVAALVVEGRTNKQIAAELFLSEKTIEKHLARIFDKLGVSKRAQVAAAIEREREPAGR